MRFRPSTVLLAAGLITAACAAGITSGPDGVIEQPAEDRDMEQVELPDMGAAPELVNEVWLNTPEALRLADLRGEVVLLEFWTFG